MLADNAQEPTASFASSARGSLEDAGIFVAVVGIVAHHSNWVDPVGQRSLEAEDACGAACDGRSSVAAKGSREEYSPVVHRTFLILPGGWERQKVRLRQTQPTFPPTSGEHTNRIRNSFPSDARCEGCG